MPHILAFDPGKATGVAILHTKKPYLRESDTVRGKDNLYQYLNRFNDGQYAGSIVVCEDYINRPANAAGFDHSWDKGYTHRIIGALDHWAWLHNFEFILKQPSQKPVAYGLLGLKYVKGKANMHHMDAAVHGFMYLLNSEYVSKSEVLAELHKGK